MAGETNIGGIVGFLRLEADQFHREIGRALAEIDLLDGRHVDISVDVDRTGAASIAATEAKVDKLDGSVKHLNTSSRNARGGVGALTTAIVALGPAMVPLAAGAVGLGAAFGGMGAAGVLAIVGVKNEMDAGTATGLAYGAAIGSAKADMQQLAKVAASNVLGSFQAAVSDLNARTPALKDQIGALATVTGKAAGALAGGLLSAFQALEPLMRDVSVYVLDLSRRFQDAMSGPGVVAFGDYVRSVFPQVMQAIESIVGAAVHLVAAFAPLGLGTLGALRMLADVINAIPVDVLAVIAQTASAVFFGFKTWQGLNVLIGGVSTALETLGVKASTAAIAVRGLQVAAGLIGVAIAALSFIFTHNAEEQRKAEEAVNRYADALRASNGVIDESIRAGTAQALEQAGVLEAAQKLGLSLSDITSAALGVPGAMERVNSVIDAHGKALTQTANSGRYAATVNSDLGNAAVKVRDAISGENAALDAGVESNKRVAAATAENAGATSNAAIAAQNLANTYGVSMSTFQAVATSQQTLADKSAQATLKMQLENDAAGILKQSLDALNGEALSAAEAQNAFESSLVNMGDHVTKTGKKVHFTTTSIKDMSSASVALRGQLNGQVANLQRVVEANGGLKDSTGKAREQMIQMRKQIIDNAVAHGVDRKAVTDYIDRLLKIPKTVPPTKLQIDTAAALAKKKALQAAINALTGKTVTLTIQQIYKTIGQRAALSVHNEQTLARHGINPNLANGGIFQGGVRKMADGGFSGRESTIMRSTRPILWNEAPGGEAYISLAPEKRARSLAIHGEVGKLLGAGTGGGSRMHPDDIRAIGKEFAMAARQMPTPRVDVDDFNRRLA